jgi:hypothetical protein
MRIVPILWYRRVVRHLLILVLLVGCSRSKPALVDLRPMTITWEGHTIAKLFADGRTESAGPNAPGTTLVAGPTLHGDGTIQLRGGVTARLAPDGEIFAKNPGMPEQHFARIENNRLVIGGEMVILADGATVRYERAPGTVIGTIDGIVDDRRRRTALLMTATFFIDMAITK